MWKFCKLKKLYYHVNICIFAKYIIKTIMKEFFYGIENLFVNYFFIPFDALREIGDYNWWLANIMVWIFLLIGTTAFTYWMIQLKKFDDNKEEDKTITAHDYL